MLFDAPLGNIGTELLDGCSDRYRLDVFQTEVMILAPGSYAV